ncbi:MULTISPECIES: SMI1/KNR4 family protein [unclassified Pseudoalteromonas]|uniref:SMI1/KNR4 family protein n=1 Tax=unclassified Pseudoalteromonas TaxID=194690 RepID=UPI0018C9F0B3|nr:MULTISPECIES: SMI1/KNR4 family protein [unclassified Pseudoalteromonas]
MTLSDKNLSAEDIKNAEEELSLKLPEPYKFFLLQNNGGVPEKCAIDFQAKKLRLQGDDIKFFFSIGGRVTNDIKYKNKPMNNLLPQGLIYIANTHSSNFIILSTREDSYGQIFYKDHEFEDQTPFDPINNKLPESIVKIADDFDEFIAKLYDPDE